LGTGRTLASQSPRCSRNLRMTLGSSMEEMTRIRFRHRGQTKGSVSYTFRINRDPFLLTSLEQSSGASSGGIDSSASRFSCLPREAFVNLLKGLEVILDALVVRGDMGLSRPVYPCEKESARGDQTVRETWNRNVKGGSRPQAHVTRIEEEKQVSAGLG
jgi:hypothetical protein